MPVDSFDAVTRHSIYVEQVKDGAEEEMNETQEEILAALILLLGKLSIDNLGQLTKRKLNDLLKRLRKTQEKAYKAYIARIVAFLQRFTRADFNVTRAMYNAIVGGSKGTLRPIYGPLSIAGTADGRARLWAIIKASPMPASGAYVVDTIQTFARRAIVQLEQRVNMGYANNERVGDFLTAVKGTQGASYRDGMMAKLYREHAAIVATAVSHASQTVQAAIASQYYASYRWSSVLDSRTTVICRSRDGKVYRFGEGPLPPAHYRCRSSIVPLDSRRDARVTFADWIKDQPADFQNDVFGRKNAEKFRAGELAVDGYNERRKLTLEAFEGKINTIVGD